MNTELLVFSATVGLYALCVAFARVCDRI